MLKFKKNGIFSRSASEEATASELQEGGVVAVWGSPGSGKTTMAVKIAKYLADKKRNVVLLLCDMTAPMLPCICPASELECERSLGSVLAAAHVTENLVKNNLVTHKRLGYLTILGMLKGENEYTYPPYGEAQARELIDCLREIAPYVVIDCGSYITTAYLRNEDIQTAVEENLEYLNPPVKSVFAEFLARIQLVDPDVDAALQDMGTKIDNAVFREWVAALLACQHDRGLKTILTPIVAKLSDMRIVNGELENMVFEPRKEFIIMQVLVVGNIPLLYFLNRDWFNTLMHTAMGQIILAVCAGVIFVSTAFVIKLTQPIEYRR